MPHIDRQIWFLPYARKQQKIEIYPYFFAKLIILYHIGISRCDFSSLQQAQELIDSLAWIITMAL